jgi:uncharacterized SAM-binding protein YcdF (DUF218 family)
MRGAARLRPLACRTLTIAVASALLGVILFLPFAGRFFDDEDPLARADVIMVLAGTRVERWLEAVDLYREGWAPRIVISPGPVARIEEQLRARGVSYPREGDLAREATLALGVPAEAVTVLPNGVDNTAQEAAALRRLPGPQPSRVIVITSTYHTRRAKFAFRRAFAGSQVTVLVRASRYGESDPARWWRQRSDIRHILSELPKYLAYVVGLGE